MAYKSQVTNKYMGSSFAGRVNPGRENELTQLAQSLNTLSDAAPRALGAYKDEQVKKAEEQLEYLKSTMSPEELNAYILKGEDPILSNKWAVSVVDGNVGRFQAGEVIKNIRENYNNYDYKTQSLQDFYSSFLPDINAKSSSFKNGFGVAFNKWSAEEYMKDADMRAVKATEEKHGNVINYLDNTVSDMNEYWTVMSSFNSKLPNTGGDENFFLTTDEMNDVALQHASFLVANATELGHYDKALQILSMDRGVGKNGQKLGSLLTTKREDVGNLRSQISNERFRFETRALQREQWQETEQVKNVLLETFTDLDITNTDAISTARKKIQMVDPTMVQTFDRLVNLERVSAVSEGDKSAFLLSIAKGDYDDDPRRMLRDFESSQMPFEMFTTALSVWSGTHTRIANGQEMIYDTNKVYSNSTDLINNSIKRSFQTSLGLDENYNEAIRYSTHYIQTSIIEFEATGDRTQEERRLFMKDLGDYVSQMYSKEMVTDPPMANYSDVQAVKEEAEGANTTVENIVNTMTQTVPQFDIDGLLEGNLGEINLADIDAVNRATTNYLRANVYPEIAQQVINQVPAYFQDNIRQFFDTLPRTDFDKIAVAMGIEPNQLYDAMAQYFQGNN